MKNSRNLLAYFFDSKLWKIYRVNVIDSYSYWKVHDPERAERWFSVPPNKLGVTIQEHIYDIFECIFKSNLKGSTKARLLSELHELETEHGKNGTLNEYI